MLLVVDSLAPGGAERHVVDLARALTAAGHAVTVACSMGGPLAADLVCAGVRVEVLLDRLVKRRFSPAFARRLRALVRRERFDLVHAHIYASATAAAAAVAGSRVPLVMTDHTEAPWRGPSARLLSRLAYRRADHVIAVSSAIRRQLLEQFGMPPDRVTYVPNAVTPMAAGAADPPLPASCRRSFLIGRVARLAPEKGFDVFLRAAATVSAHEPHAHFAVVGDGPLREELHVLAHTLGIADRVHFLGHRDDARALIGRLDMLVVSSLTDGSPLVNLEAMAAGTPVIASACGGIPDQIRDGADGLLVPPGDADALARAMRRVMRDEALARRLCDSAMRRAETEFAYVAMIARIETCYRFAAGARRRSAESHATTVPSRLRVQ